MPEWVSLKLHSPSYRAEMSFEIMVPKGSWSGVDHEFPEGITNPADTGRSTTISYPEGWAPFMLDQTLTAKPRMSDDWDILFKDGLSQALGSSILPAGTDIDSLEFRTPARKKSIDAGEMISSFKDRVGRKGEWRTSLDRKTGMSEKSVLSKDYEVKAKGWNPESGKWVSVKDGPTTSIRVSMVMSCFERLSGIISDATPDSVTVSPCRI